MAAALAAAALALACVPSRTTTTTTTTAASSAALPGASCASLGAAQAHTFVALAWSSTCECTDPAFPPQANGSFCIYWDPSSPCEKTPVCRTNASTGEMFSVCKVFDNIAVMPRMLGVTGATPFGDTANVTAPLYAEAINKMPVGHRALMLHDLDQGMDGNSNDYVLLPREAAECADPPTPPKYDGGEPAPPPLKTPSFATIWWDAAALQRRGQSAEWFPAFAKVGGQIDTLAMDSEQTRWGWVVPTPPANLPEANKSAALRCIRERWNAIQADSRFSTGVLPLLVRLRHCLSGVLPQPFCLKQCLSFVVLQLQAGFKPVGGMRSSAGNALGSPTALADTLTPFSASDAAYADQTDDMNRVVWNAVMAQRANNHASGGWCRM